MFVYKQVIFQLNLEVRAALQNIYGIGWHKSFYICARMGLVYPFLVKNLNIYYALLLYYILDFFTWLEIRIKRIIHQNIKNLYDIGTYKGLRHKDSLPTRGQRTRTNASTKKRYKIILDD